MTNNPILDELHETRKRLLAESGGTVSGLLDRLRAEQAASGRPVFDAAANHPMQPSGEVGRFEVDDQPSPPADR